MNEMGRGLRLLCADCEAAIRPIGRHFLNARKASQGDLQSDHNTEREMRHGCWEKLSWGGRHAHARVDQSVQMAVYAQIHLFTSTV